MLSGVVHVGCLGVEIAYATSVLAQDYYPGDFHARCPTAKTV